MDVAGNLSESPWPTGEEVVDQFREESDHQTQITNGQVHDQHVRWSSEGRGAAEDAKHAVVAERCDDACKILSRMNIVLIRSLKILIFLIYF